MDPNRWLPAVCRGQPVPNEKHGFKGTRAHDYMQLRCQVRESMWINGLAETGGCLPARDRQFLPDPVNLARQKMPRRENLADTGGLGCPVWMAPIPISSCAGLTRWCPVYRAHPHHVIRGLDPRILQIIETTCEFTWQEMRGSSPRMTNLILNIGVQSGDDVAEFVIIRAGVRRPAGPASPCFP